VFYTKKDVPSENSWCPIISGLKHYRRKKVLYSIVCHIKFQASVYGLRKRPALTGLRGVLSIHIVISTSLHNSKSNNWKGKQENELSKKRRDGYLAAIFREICVRKH